MTEPVTPDQIDAAALQDARDDSDPGPLSAPTSDEIAAFQERLDRAGEYVRELPEDERQAWRDKWDTEAEFRGER